MAQNLDRDYGKEIDDLLNMLLQPVGDHINKLKAERDDYKRLWMEVIAEKIALVKQVHDLQVKLQAAEACPHAT